MTVLANVKESIAVALNKQMVGEFSPNEIIVSGKALNVEEASKNAKCRITMNKEGYAGVGSSVYQQQPKEKTTLINFNKLSLSQLGTTIGGALKVNTIGKKPTNVHAILRDVATTLTIAIAPSDVLNSAIVWDGDTGTATLTATPNSLALTGSISLMVVYQPSELVQGAVLIGTQTRVTSTGSLTTQTKNSNGFIFEGLLALGNGNRIGFQDPVTFAITYSPTAPVSFDAFVRHGNSVYALTPTSQLYRYDLLTGAWDSTYYTCQRRVDRSSAITTTAVVALGNYIYAVGGRYISGNFNVRLNFVDRFNVDTGVWDEVANLPFNVAETNLQTFNGEIYAAGGWLDTGYSDSIIKFNPDLGTWVTMSAKLTSPRTVWGCVCNGRVYYFGGLANIGNGTVGSLKTVDSFDPLTDTAVRIGDMNTPWLRMAAFSMGDYVILSHSQYWTTGDLKGDVGLTAYK